MKTCCLLCLVLIIALSTAQGAERRFPGPLFPAGNSSLTAPFNPGTSSSRLEQVYLADIFALHPGEGYLLREIRFRVDEQTAIPFTATFPDSQVNLSVTSRGPDGLSRTYADNIGLNETVVFGRGSLTVSSLGGGFDVRIPFARPFLYDPTVGNLLVDISNFHPAAAPPMDAVYMVGDSASIVVGEADALTGAAISSALATEFEGDIVPIPEPVVWTLAGLTMVVVALGPLRRLCLKSMKCR